MIRDLLALRRRELTPRLRGSGAGAFDTLGGHALAARWRLGDGVHARAAREPGRARGRRRGPGRPPLWASSPAVPARLAAGALPGFAVAAALAPGGAP